MEAADNQTIRQSAGVLNLVVPPNGSSPASIGSDNFVENVHKRAYNRSMDSEYEWDPRKAASNLRKHGVAFAEAVIALEDEMALTCEDDHPSEKRYITIGADDVGRILVVVHTYRGEKIRIISARIATPRERKQYSESI